MARLDTGWHTNPKVLSTGVYGMALHAWSISYCDAARSDGFVPRRSWPALLHRGVALLVEAKLWEPVRGGYQLHDYTHYNRTREQIEAAQVSTRDRVTRNRRRYAQGRNGVTNEPSNGDGNASRAYVPGPGPGVTPTGVTPGTPPTPSTDADAQGGSAPRVGSPPTEDEDDPVRQLRNGAAICPICRLPYTGPYLDHTSAQHKVKREPGLGNLATQLGRRYQAVPDAPPPEVAAQFQAMHERLESFGGQADA